jgi:hypothetical protein
MNGLGLFRCAWVSAQSHCSTTGIVWLKWNVHKTQEIYNLTVATAHTFFVGDGQWLVHNACPGRGGRHKNDLVPDPHATGPHSTFKKDQTTGKVTNYATWEQNPYYGGKWEETIRYDAVGKSHAEIGTKKSILPHVHDKNMSRKFVRKPFRDEIPR